MAFAERLLYSTPPRKDTSLRCPNSLSSLIPLFLFLCCLGCSSSSLSAQDYFSRMNNRVRVGDTTQVHQVILLDYSKLLGVVEKIEEGELYFRLHGVLDVTRFPLEQVRYVGLYIPPGSAGRLGGMDRLGMTDMTYERTALPYTGRGQVKIINLVYAVSEFNINENLQLGAGLGGPLGVIGTARYRYSISPYVHVGASAQVLYPFLLGRGFNNNSIILLGDVTGLATFGTERKFLNIGTGFMFNTDAFDEKTLWVHRAGAGGAISDHWHLYGELLFTLSNDEFFRQLSVFPSISASWSMSRHRWRFGIFTNFIDSEELFVPPLPYVGYSFYW